MSSTFAAIINLAKLCIGTGILALPVATARGGLLLYPVVLGIVAVWNAVSCLQLIECKKAIVQQSTAMPPGISSTYSQIAFAASGWYGVYITDFSVIVTLFGVCISYQITFAALLSELPFSFIPESSSKAIITMISGLLLLPLCRVKSLKNLSFMSLAALVCLTMAALTILIYGVVLYGRGAMGWDRDKYLGNKSEKNVLLWSENSSDVMFLLGVSTYCFGLCAAVIPIEENMQFKGDFGKAVAFSLLLVWVMYVVMGDGASFLYAYDVKGVQDNILLNLPRNSTVANIVRVSMAAVCLLSYPLPFVPPTQMLEKLLLHSWQVFALRSVLAMHPEKEMGATAATTTTTNASNNARKSDLTEENELVPLYSSEASGGSGGGGSLKNVKAGPHDPYVFNTEELFTLKSSMMLPAKNNKKIGPLDADNLTYVSSNNSSIDDNDSEEETNTKLIGMIVRAVFILLCTLLATCFPCFGMVISLLGCFTVTILSFLLPAYFHLQLVSSRKILYSRGREQVGPGNIENGLGYNTSSNSDRYNSYRDWVLYLFDLLLTVAGGLLCVVSTYLIVADFVRKFSNGTLSC